MSYLKRAHKSLKLSFLLVIFGSFMKIMHIAYANEVFVTGLLTGFAVYPAYFYLKKEYDLLNWARLIFVEISAVVMALPLLFRYNLSAGESQLKNGAYAALTVVWIGLEIWHRFRAGKNKTETDR